MAPKRPIQSTLSATAVACTLALAWRAMPLRCPFDAPPMPLEADGDEPREFKNCLLRRRGRGRSAYHRRALKLRQGNDPHANGRDAPIATVAVGQVATASGGQEAPDKRPGIR